MNTKQIWNALMHNEITEPYFDGVYASDMLKNIVIKPNFIICNTDNSYQEGKHWVCFFFEKEMLYFYDSLGKDINNYCSQFIDFAEKYAIKCEQSIYKTQPTNTDICGEMCLFFAYYKCKGYSMTNILNKMTDSENVINFVNKKYKICKKSTCKLLQSCIIME